MTSRIRDLQKWLCMIVNSVYVGVDWTPRHEDMVENYIFTRIIYTIRIDQTQYTYHTWYCMVEWPLTCLPVCSPHLQRLWLCYNYTVYRFFFLFFFFKFQMLIMFWIPKAEFDGRILSYIFCIFWSWYCIFTFTQIWVLGTFYYLYDSICCSTNGICLKKCSASEIFIECFNETLNQSWSNAKEQLRRKQELFVVISSYKYCL